MAYSKDVEAAKALAYRLHKGQVDKVGIPYITHPERVAGRLSALEEQVVGWLHDTVEDTGITLAEIETQFGSDTVAAVDAVSRRDGEDWNDYLRRVKRNEVARKVKISDLIDNSNLSRIPSITMRDVDRQEKYNKSLRFLLEDPASESGKPAD
ncbi:MAG: HD domain-containing protein [Clostridia bacterium]|nr:HD domain-containing protein [Clostridia bacterium]